MEYIIYYLSFLLAISICIIYENYKKIKKYKDGNYPAHLFVDGNNYLNFSIGSNLNYSKPRILYKFQEEYSDPGKSKLVPIICNDNLSFQNWKNVLTTINDVHNWERGEFNKYKSFVEKYLIENGK